MWTACDRHSSNFSQSFPQGSTAQTLLTAEEIVNTYTCQRNDACCLTPAKLLYWFCLCLSKEQMLASQPAKKHDGWAGMLLLGLLMFVVLIQIKCRGFEKCNWHLLTSILFPPVPQFGLAPLHLFIAWNKKKPKIFSNKSATFKVYNQTYSMQLLCKFWIHQRPS